MNKTEWIRRWSRSAVTSSLLTAPPSAQIFSNYSVEWNFTNERGGDTIPVLIEIHQLASETQSLCVIQDELNEQIAEPDDTLSPTWLTVLLSLIQLLLRLVSITLNTRSWPSNAANLLPLCPLITGLFITLEEFHSSWDPVPLVTRISGFISQMAFLLDWGTKEASGRWVPLNSTRVETLDQIPKHV